MLNMRTYDTYDVVKKLLGEINPVGEYNEDNERFDNLEETIDLTRKLIYNIREVSFNKTRYEHSMREAGVKAQSFMNELGLKND